MKLEGKVALVTGFDELVALRESMEHLFEEMYSCRPPLFRVAPVMWETDAALVFRAELPSADPARIEVSMSEDMLTVTAEGLRRAIPLPVAVAPGPARGPPGAPPPPAQEPPP